MLGGAARAAIAQSTFVNRLEGITAGDIMDAEPVTIPASISALTAYDDYFLRYQGWIWFPAVEEDGRFVGLAHRAAVEHAALSEGGTALVRELVADADPVSTDTTLETLVGSEPLRTPRSGHGGGRRRPSAGRRDPRSGVTRVAGAARSLLAESYCPRPCPRTTC